MFAEVFRDAKLRPSRARGRSWSTGAAVLLMLFGLGSGCYRGGERDKDPPPGLPGGLCLAPDGFCQSGTCNRDQNFCYDPADPCHGFFCGGDDRGVCFPDAMGQPSCQCDVGYSNEQFPLYCCPDPSLGIFDEYCGVMGPAPDQPFPTGESEGDEDEDGSSG